MSYQTVSYSIRIIALLISLVATLTSARASIGVCYGRVGDNLPPPAQVVGLLKSKGITAVRIYDADAGVLDAFAGSGINLIIGVINNDLQKYATDPAAALDWVRASLANLASQISVRYVVVGNEVIPGDLDQHVFNAIKNIQAAIDSLGLGDKVKATTSVSMSVLGESFPPSAGALSAEAQPVLGQVAPYLASIGAPLLLNAYPYFAYRDNRDTIAIEYALFTSPNVVVHDGDFQYKALFDAMVDAMYAAMAKIPGAENFRLVVSETGWPSAGDFATTTANAQTYNQNLIGHVGQGTPRRPGAALETYIFAVFNENLKQPELEKHWGLFNPDTSPAYPIQFS